MDLQQYFANTSEPKRTIPKQIRASFGFYNQIAEIDAYFDALEDALAQPMTPFQEMLGQSFLGEPLDVQGDLSEDAVRKYAEVFGQIDASWTEEKVKQEFEYYKEHRALKPEDLEVLEDFAREKADAFFAKFSDNAMMTAKEWVERHQEDIIEALKTGLNDARPVNVLKESFERKFILPWLKGQTEKLGELQMGDVSSDLSPILIGRSMSYHWKVLFHALAPGERWSIVPSEQAVSWVIPFSEFNPSVKFFDLNESGVIQNDSSDVSFYIEIQKSDAAMFATQQKDIVQSRVGDPNTKGGIDFDPTAMKFETTGDAAMFNVSPEQLQQFIDAPGFTPFIINIAPVVSPRLWLGLVVEGDSPKQAGQSPIGEGGSPRKAGQPPKQTADALWKNSLSFAIEPEDIVHI